MNCEQVKDWMPHYLEGLMSPDREHSIRLHIKSCPACSQSLGEAREMASFWREMERKPWVQEEMLDIPDITAAVMAEIQRFEADRSIEQVSSRRRYTPRTSWTHYSLAACLTFLLFQFGVFENLAYQITEINVQMSSSVTAWFGPQAN